MKNPALLLPLAAAAVAISTAHADNLEQLMGVPAGAHATIVPRPDTPHTAFFLAEQYKPTLAVPTDAVQLYATLGGSSSLVGGEELSAGAAIADSWNRKGYATQLFLHSRYGNDVRDIPAEHQKDQGGFSLAVISTTLNGKGVDLAVGPMTPEFVAAMRAKHGPDAVIREVDHYLIPTREKIEFAKKFYVDSLRPGTTGFCFDEPEIWADAGYSDAFKAEWKEFYGTDWVAPHTSVDARYRAERLKSHLVRRWVETVLLDVKARRPDITLLLATHSQSSYSGIGMGAHHHALLSIPILNEVVAEVWNEPFDSAFAQYSSFWHMTRNRHQQLWLMADPWGDSPAISLDYYRRSYGDNIVSALMFPGADRYQPLIWPNRLYGQIPREYETIINSVTGVLAELWRFRDGTVHAGTTGVATFVSDSMSWQRSEPAPSDFDGYEGLTLPLVRRGVPVDVLPLERVAEPDFLQGTKVALLSYDFLKPTDPAQNRALANWTKVGGVLVCFGGTDAYNAVRDAPWSRAGFDTPLEELFSLLGLPPARPHVLAETAAGTIEALAATATPAAFTVPVGPSTGERQYRLNKTIYGQVEVPPKITDPTYPLTLYPLPPGGQPLYRLKSSGQPVIWSARAGKGTVIFAGIAPGFLKTNAAGPDVLATLVRTALAARGEGYEETGKFMLTRGPYTAVRTFATPQPLTGRYVDVFSPRLEVLTDPVVPANANALFVAVDLTGRSEPRAISGRLDAWFANDRVTSLVVRAPANTAGAARLGTGGRKLASASATTRAGAPVAVQAQEENGTLLLTYPNDADGVVLRVEWQTAP